MTTEHDANGQAPRQVQPEDSTPGVPQQPRERDAAPTSGDGQPTTPAPHQDYPEGDHQPHETTPFPG